MRAIGIAAACLVLAATATAARARSLELSPNFGYRADGSKSTDITADFARHRRRGKAGKSGKFGKRRGKNRHRFE
jgi:hypothetical protein